MQIILGALFRALRHVGASCSLPLNSPTQATLIPQNSPHPLSFFLTSLLPYFLTSFFYFMLKYPMYNQSPFESLPNLGQSHSTRTLRPLRSAFGTFLYFFCVNNLATSVFLNFTLTRSFSSNSTRLRKMPGVTLIFCFPFSIFVARLASELPPRYPEEVAP